MEISHPDPQHGRVDLHAPASGPPPIRVSSHRETRSMSL